MFINNLKNIIQPVTLYGHRIMSKKNMSMYSNLFHNLAIEEDDDLDYEIEYEYNKKKKNIYEIKKQHYSSIQLKYRLNECTGGLCHKCKGNGYVINEPIMILGIININTCNECNGTGFI
tara:strand:- start:4214 stop:4570 length:357 start_codon:yes stop_codon:yes gene_type:complete